MISLRAALVYCWELAAPSPISPPSSAANQAEALEPTLHARLESRAGRTRNADHSTASALKAAITSCGSFKASQEARDIEPMNVADAINASAVQGHVLTYFMTTSDFVPGSRTDFESRWR